MLGNRKTPLFIFQTLEDRERKKKKKASLFFLQKNFTWNNELLKIMNFATLIPAL